MTDDLTREVLLEDEGFQAMVRFYGAVNDWFENITHEKRGGRAKERLAEIRDDGFLPLVRRYAEFTVSESGSHFSGDVEELLDELEDEFRLDYVEESDAVDFSELGAYRRRLQLSPEIRLATFASSLGGTVNSVTIAQYDEDELPSESRDEFTDIWSEYWRRFDDLYWERRFQIADELALENDEAFELSAEDEETWDEREELYPEFPFGVVIGGEEVQNIV